MYRSIEIWSILFLVMVLVIGSGSRACGQSQQVTISGNIIQIDGVQKPLVGFTFIGRLNPSSCASSLQSNAWNRWGTNSSADLIQARDTYHANTIRIQVAQAALYDSTGALDPSFVSQYITSVADATALIRSLGLVAEISMQWETSQSGNNRICDDYGNMGAVLNGVPDTNTDHAWAALLTSAAWTHNTSTGTTMNLANDKGVVLEMYNEPGLGGTCGQSTQWSVWNTNLQARINWLRGYDTLGNPISGDPLTDTHALIVPGLAQDHQLDATAFGYDALSSHLLVDTIPSPASASLIYAMHSYPATTPSSGSSCYVGEYTSDDWMRWFGNQAQNGTVPILISEWYTGSVTGTNCQDGQPVGTAPGVTPVRIPYGHNWNDSYESYEISPAFMTWLSTAGPIKDGVGTPLSLSGVFNFDTAGMIVTDFSSYNPTTFNPSTFTCGVSPKQGPGADIQSYFNAVH